ncbi:MAG: hypothetical protein HETSPECPRED_002203 [Heterodermia speciosa]|uniref:TNT domain-containing protein n=1 Tax=Heterodermia speciosa TaxID=116794 RepID=A0A8H3J3S9_9LECA|nr:MAG: hypothetical protein HETSPECPRED_002203 [Heterodermia speciosa]
MFSKSVQEMIYDLSFYDPCFSQSIDQYLFALKRSYFQTRRDNSLFEYSRALRGYKIYEERVYWQHQILSQHVEHNATESLRGLAVLDLNIGSSGELLGETDDHLGKLAYNWSLFPLAPVPTPTQCDCRGTNDTGPAGSNYVCNDPRLGPLQLPTVFPLLSFVSDYDRFGGRAPGQFLAKWTDPKTGYFSYPPQDGFQLDVEGKPIKGKMTLAVGAEVDRFGSEYGKFVSAADSPYDQRALPPANLDTPPDTPDYPYNYHVYTVNKTLNVIGGPIAPWFGQPGLGAQFYIGDTGNVLQLIEQGYLVRHHKSEIAPGPGSGGGCW